MRLGPFSHRQAAALWGIDDPQLAFQLQAVLGGALGYRQLVQDDPPAGIDGSATEPWTISSTSTSACLRLDSRP